MTRKRRRFPLNALILLACLVLAGWALWDSGLFRGAIPRAVQGNSVYAEAGTGVDVAAAEKIIGNRALVLIFTTDDDTGRAADLCDSIPKSAPGTMTVFVANNMDTYPCSDYGDFGDRFVAEQLIGQGISSFGDDKLGAVKVIVYRYDLLASVNEVSPHARTIVVSMPQYLIAAGALLAVVLGSAGLYFGGRRLGQVAETEFEARQAFSDAKAIANARLASVAAEIVATGGPEPSGGPERARPVDRAVERAAARFPAVRDRLVAAQTPADLHEVETQLARIESALHQAR